MAKLLLFSGVLCAAVAAVMCAATAFEGKTMHYSLCQACHKHIIVNVADGKAVEKRDYFSYLQQGFDPEDRFDEELEENEIAVMEEDDELSMQGNIRGVAYVRWGRSVCPKGAELVYAGRAAGSHYSHSGGGSNYQCVTLTPENFDFGPGTVPASFLYGSEYEMWGNAPKALLPLHNHNVPCAVCYVTRRTAIITIPGTYKCPAKWTMEYYGYLMAERHNHHRSTFECVDKEPEAALGGHENHDGALFYVVEPRCGSLPCPPYDQQKEMTCAVCTR